MGYSARINMYRYPKKDGTCGIYLKVIIDRKVVKLNLDISWPREKFSETHGCKPRRRQDPDVEEYNVIIENARAKANAIHKSYLLRGLPLAMDTFIKEFKSDLNKNDFIEYFAQKSFYRWDKHRISQETYEKEKGTVKKLREFAKLQGAATIPFHDFTPEWAHDFDRFLKREYGVEINGRWNRHKHIVTYLHMAKEDRITFQDPYVRFKITMTDGNWKPLEMDQMKLLLEKYIEWRDKPLPVINHKKDDREGLSSTEIIVLRRFLFSCNTALRISDLQSLDRSRFSNGEMSITPKKTERYGTNIRSVPLNDVARMMLDDEIKDNPTDNVFGRFTDNYSNRILKRIAEKTNLNLNLHHHVARYTFASIMDQAGANHTGLMKYMGLRKRETLEKYVKTNKKVIADDIEKMNRMINLADQQTLTTL